PTATTVHPTAVGSGTRPDMTEPSSQSSDSGSAQVGDSSSEYPKQLHAGAVGYGPNYHVGPTMTDKIAGMKEVVKGKVTKNPDLIQHGQERRTGVLHEKERESDMQSNPFEHADDGDSKQHNMREQAATVAPEGTDAASQQRQG
ncbi:hypothetical protein CPB85DRAFT_1198282, partial [Mucidula mucida]